MPSSTYLPSQNQQHERSESPGSFEMTLDSMTNLSQIAEVEARVQEIQRACSSLIDRGLPALVERLEKGVGSHAYQVSTGLEDSLSLDACDILNIDRTHACPGRLSSLELDQAYIDKLQLFADLKSGHFQLNDVQSKHLGAILRAYTVLKPFTLEQRHERSEQEEDGGLLDSRHLELLKNTEQHLQDGRSIDLDLRQYSYLRPVLALRRDRLAHQGFMWDLVATADEAALLRLCVMGEAFTTEEATYLREILQRLDPQKLSWLVTGLTAASRTIAVDSIPRWFPKSLAAHLRNMECLSSAPGSLLNVLKALVETLNPALLLRPSEVMSGSTHADMITHSESNAQAGIDIGELKKVVQYDVLPKRESSPMRLATRSQSSDYSPQDALYSYGLHLAHQGSAKFPGTPPICDEKFLLDRTLPARTCLYETAEPLGLIANIRVRTSLALVKDQHHQ